MPNTVNRLIALINKCVDIKQGACYDREHVSLKTDNAAELAKYLSGKEVLKIKGEKVIIPETEKRLG